MKFRCATWALTAALLVVPAGVTLGAGPASAVRGDGVIGSVSSLAGSTGQTNVVHETSQACLSALKVANERRAKGVAVAPESTCDVTIVATESTARTLSPTEAVAVRGVAGVLLDTNPVYSKSYLYTVYQGTDQENMKGTYYYDGFHVWQSSSYRGHIGSKSCWVSYSDMYSIDIKACTGGGNATSSIAAHMQLFVSVKLVSWREDYYVTMKPGGTSSIRKG